MYISVKCGQRDNFNWLKDLTLYLATPYNGDVRWRVLPASDGPGSVIYGQ